jgi:phosphoribosyl-AMP cyclohydrolase
MVELDFAKQNGLVTAVAQDAEDGTVLMVAYMNQEAWEKTLATGIATYWSRSRSKLWVKGESSGHTQEVREILVDCDNDTVVLKIIQKGGAACHEGYRSCFFRKVTDGDAAVVSERIFDPAEVYKK